MKNISPLFLKHQGPMLGSLGKVALGALGGPSTTSLPDCPGPKSIDTIDPRATELVDAYVEWCGADPSLYRDCVPAHLFPQWGFPLLSQSIADLPYKLTGVLNQGCKVEINAPIERDERLNLTGWLEDVQEVDGKARIHQRLITGTSAHDEALIADVFAVVLLAKKSGGSKRDPEELSSFTDIGGFNAHLKDGRNFGFLTGDLNPIHWIGPLAKMSGFKRPILHGFGSFARSFELIQQQTGGSIKRMEVRFLKPLVLPASTRLLTRKQGKKTKAFDVRLIDGDGNLCMAGECSLG